MPRKRLTPQEKKIKSYQKDRRNRYGENDKASRKAIPARKAAVNRRFRRGVKTALTTARANPEAMERALDRVHRGCWCKTPDVTIAEILARGDSFKRQGLDSKRSDKHDHRKVALARLRRSGRVVNTTPLKVGHSLWMPLPADQG